MTSNLRRFAKRQFYSLLTMEGIWSIGIYSGDSPFSLSPSDRVRNPVLTADDVTDIPAVALADPFAVRKDDGWYLFFEAVRAEDSLGCIGYARSDDGYSWRYGGIILNEPFHLSYPYVFEWNGEYYMIPESHAAGEIRLYRAVDFPSQWRLESSLMEGRFVDPSIFRHGGRWWLLASTGPNDNRVNTLCLFHADRLTGPWAGHPMNPVIRDNRRFCRCGGRVTAFDNRIVRYVQDDYPTYGYQVLPFEITELSKDRYAEKAIDPRTIISGTGKGWNAEGMHNIDAHPDGQGGWLAFVDGYRLARPALKPDRPMENNGYEEG